MALKRYLTRHAEPDQGAAQALLGEYDRCVVIPCRDEASCFAGGLQAWLRARPKALAIVVVNQPETQEDTAQNSQLHQAMMALELPNLLVLDHFSEGRRIPPKQGVGLARKIGCDLACRLIQSGRVTTRWIHTTDADVSWPELYPLALHQVPEGTAAVCYPYRHSPRIGAAGQAIALYERSLDYYVAGLTYAGSPYAYHTLGSTLALNYQHYASVHGFPKRSAGEDFHLLNKLRKTGPILSLPAPELTIADRESLRVPFGTGPAVERILQLADPAGEYLFYHPDCFRALRSWLQVLPRLWIAGNTDRAFDLMGAQLSKHTIEALEHCAIRENLAHAFGHSRSEATWLRHVHNHFDALASLRFVHHLRDHRFPSVNLVRLESTGGILAADGRASS